MRIRARQTGDVIDLEDEGAQTLIDAGIYDAVESKKAPPPKKPDKPDKSTKVEPLTTEDIPVPPKKAA